MLINCVGQEEVVSLANTFKLYPYYLGSLFTIIFVSNAGNKPDTAWQFDNVDRRNIVLRWILENFSQQAPLEE